MTEKRKKREKQIEKIFKAYNGSAVSYHSSETASRSVSRWCANGSTIPRSTSVEKLINEVRK